MKKQRLLCIFFSVALLFCCSAALVSAETINLPATGQTKCYNSSGAEIACAGTGQDGDKRMGVAWPNPRFTVNGDCITDNLTGQIWPQNVNLANGTKTWQEALDFVKSLNAGGGLCGKTDWRLPSILELESLVNVGSNEGKTSRAPANPVFTNGDYLVKFGFSIPGSVPNGVVAWSATPYNPRNQTNGPLSFYVGNLGTGETDYRDGGFAYLAVPVQGNACKYNLESPDKIYLSPLISYLEVRVHPSPKTCSWSAKSPFYWIRITGGATGTGDGSVFFYVDAMDDKNMQIRKGYIDIEYQSIMIIQTRPGG